MKILHKKVKLKKKKKINNNNKANLDQDLEAKNSEKIDQEVEVLLIDRNHFNM